MAVMVLFTSCVVLVLFPSLTPSLIFLSAMMYVSADGALAVPSKSQLLDYSTAARHASAMPWMAVQTSSWSFPSSVLVSCQWVSFNSRGKNPLGSCKDLRWVGVRIMTLPIVIFCATMSFEVFSITTT